MGKKCGLRMATGGLLDPKRPSTGGPIVTGGIRGYSDFAEGGIVRGKGGPTDDEVPMRVAGKDVNLSNSEAVLPAKTVQALGGPEAVEGLIEQTNGKPPVKGGLREGGAYYTGTPGDTIDPRELRPEFREAAPKVEPVQRMRQPGAAPSPEATKFAEARVTQDARFAQAEAAKVSPQPAATPEAPKSKLGAATAGAKNLGGKLIKGAGYTMAAMGAADAMENGINAQNAAEMGAGVLSSDAGRAAVMNVAGRAAPAVAGLGAAASVAGAGLGGYAYGSHLSDKAESGEKMNRLEATVTAAGQNLGKAYARYAPEFMGGLDSNTVKLADQTNGGAGWTTIKSLRDGDPQKVAAAEAAKAAPTTAPTAAPTAPGAAGTDINVKGMTPEQRTLAADAYRDYVDQQTGVGPTNNRGDGPINYGGMQRRIDAYGKDPGLLAARNAREDLLGSGIRMGVDGKGGLTINNTGDRSNGTLAAAGGTAMDMKGANEIYARANAIRGQMLDAQHPAGGYAVLGGGTGRMSDERAALLKKTMTAHPGSQNGQLTLGQMNAARGLMGDVQNEQLKAQELGINAQRVAAEGSTKQQELGLRAQEAASLDAYRKGSLTNDAQKATATAKAAAQTNYLALSKDQRETMDGYVKKMIPTDGLKDGDLSKRLQEQAEMTEAIMKAAGGRLPMDPQELQSVLPQLIDQGRLTVNERNAAMNPSLGDRLSNLMGGNVEREGSMYAKNTVTLSNGNIVQVGKNGKVVGPELDPRKVYGRNADLREAAEQRRGQFAAQQ